MPAQKIKNYFANPQNRFDYSRSIFNYERIHSTNLLTGAIVPVGFVNCMPGTTVPNKFGFVLQSAPLLGPSLDNVYIDIIAVWIPTRLVMADFNEWLGDNDTYAWTLGNSKHLPKVTNYYMPTYVDSGGSNVNCSLTYLAEHCLGPHFGMRTSLPQMPGTNYIPFQSILSVGDRFYEGLSVIPSRMYDLVYNTMFRNENIQAPVLFSKQSGTNLSLDVTNYNVGLGQIRFANRLKNVFNQARLGPSIQTVDIGLGKDLPVFASSSTHNLSTYSLIGVDGSGNAHSGPLVSTPQGAINVDTGSLGSDLKGFRPNNLWAELSGLTVNSLYYSIMLQKYMNKASSGRRPIEFYKTMFGISRSDAGHDDPELLCQKRYKVNISRVVATGNSTDSQGNLQGLGTQGAFSVTSVGGVLFPEFTATEYGMLQIYAVIRTQESISTGIDRYLSDHELLSTYLPVFDHIGEDYIDPMELSNYISGGVFGYQTAWYNYRYQMNDAVGIFSEGETLDYMTFSRGFYSGTSVINSSYITQSPKEFDRLLQLPVFYKKYGTDPEADVYGEPMTSDRYQWIIQFALAGDLVQTMSKDSEPLLFGNKL